MFYDLLRNIIAISGSDAAAASCVSAGKTAGVGRSVGTTAAAGGIAIPILVYERTAGVL